MGRHWYCIFALCGILVIMSNHVVDAYWLPDGTPACTQTSSQREAAVTSDGAGGAIVAWKDLRHGIGGAISFDTPIGPADFSIGRSFIINQGLKENSFVWGDVLFYFSIGHAVSF